jgi:protein TonB
MWKFVTKSSFYYKHNIMKNEQALFGKQWIDIVFEKRNTAYGAYQLRQNYERNMAFAMIIVLSGFATLFLSIKIVQHFFSKPTVPIVDLVIELKDIVVPKIDIPKPMETQPPAGKLPIDNRTKAFKVKEQIADVVLKDTIVR